MKFGLVLIVRDKYLFQEFFCFFVFSCSDIFCNIIEVFLLWERWKQFLILFVFNCQLMYQFCVKCYIYIFQNGLFIDVYLISLFCLLSEGSLYLSDCFFKKSVNLFFLMQEKLVKVFVCLFLKIDYWFMVVELVRFDDFVDNIFKEILVGIV